MLTFCLLELCESYFLGKLNSETHIYIIKERKKLHAHTHPQTCVLLCMRTHTHTHTKSTQNTPTNQINNKKKHSKNLPTGHAPCLTVLDAIRTLVGQAAGLAEVTGLHALHGAVVEIIIQDVQPCHAFHTLCCTSVTLSVMARRFA